MTTVAATVQPASSGAIRFLGRIIFAPVRAASWVGGRLSTQWQNVLTAFVQIWANKARSVLTTLGIIIAVTSTITVVSFVQGFGDYVTNMLRGFGTNIMFVVPWVPSGDMGRAFAGRALMDINDVHAVGAECDKVRRISPMLFMGGTVEYGRTKAEDVRIQGATEQFQTIRNFFADEGRFFGPIDVDVGNYVCVVGREVLKKLEADERLVGDYIYINSIRFQVLGVLEAKGQFMDDNQDNTVLIPYSAVLKMFPFLSRWMPFIVEAGDEKEVMETTLQISRVLRTRHALQPGMPNDFRIFTQDEMLRDFERVKMVATSVLAGIVGISLIVGGIGIMNIMLVSVTERTKEIGLRKSVGGRRRDILLQFLTEAVVLATVGGIIGIALGYSICSIASLHPSMVKIAVPVWAVMLALGFCVGVGVLFGIIPAFKAAILHPIDALRHE